MRKKGVILFVGFIVIVSGWWVISRSSLAQPEAGIIDVWATSGDDPAQLQALLDRYSETSGVPVRVTTRVRSDDLLEALAGIEPPDLVILSSADLVKAYNHQGLVEALNRWIQATGIDLDDMYPALQINPLIHSSNPTIGGRHSNPLIGILFMEFGNQESIEEVFKAVDPLPGKEHLDRLLGKARPQKDLL